MKILLVTSYFAPAWAYGGPPRVMFDYARGLRELGHDVTVYTTDVLDQDRFHGSMHEEMSGIEVVRFRNLSNRLAWKRKRFLPLGYRGHLRKTIEAFDFVLMADIRTHLNLVTYLSCRKHRIPFGLCSFGSLPSRRRISKAVCDFVFSDRMIGRADWLFAQTDHEISEYARHGGRQEQMRLLPLPVDIPDVSPDGRKYDRLRLVFVGRIHYLKGLQNIIDALSSISHDVDFDFSIIGRDDGYLDDIMSRIEHSGLQNRITFCGPLYGSEKEKVLQNSNLFVITPLNYEETSTAALEAAAAGCALMITPQADVPYLGDYQGGIRVRNDIDSIASGIRKVAADLESLSVMGDNARRLIEERFDHVKVARQIDACMRESCTGLSGLDAQISSE